ANFWISAGVAFLLGTRGAIDLHFWTAWFWSKAPRLVPTVASLGLATVIVVSVVGLATARQSSFQWDCFGACSINFNPDTHPLLGWWPWDDSKGVQGVFRVPWRDVSFTLPFDSSGAHFHTVDLLYVGLAVLA